GVFASSREPAELPLLSDTPPSGPQYEAFVKERAKRVGELEAYRTRRRDEVIAASIKPEVLGKYLLAAVELRDADAAALTKSAQERGLHAHLATRWRDYIKTAITK